jgi:16S rRNA processing protein RimM
MQVVVGRLGRPHGVKGEINIEVLTDDPQKRFSVGSKLIIQNKNKELTVKTMRLHTKKLLVFFEEIPDRNLAEEYKGSYLAIELDESEIPQDGDEFYDDQLIGLSAFSQKRELFGEVVDIIHGTAQDLLVIKTPDKTDVLVPFVDEIVPTIDLAKKEIILTPPNGLFDDSAIEAR